MKKPAPIEKRHELLRRQINDYFAAEGGFPITGKLLTVWLIVTRPDAIIPHWELLLVLLGLLIFPKVIEKIAISRYGGNAKANGQAPAGK